MEEHRLRVKVYLEDTDAQGIVYHANYLKFFERSRSEMLRVLGLEIRDLTRPERMFVVHEMRLKFQRAARLGDEIEVRSSMRRASDYRLTFDQQALSSKPDDGPLVTAEVQVVCIDANGNLLEVPPVPPS